MEERIQRKVEEFKMRPHSFFKPSPTYEVLREEAVRKIQEEIAHEENLKKRMQQHEEQRVRIEQQHQEKKEEEEREQLKWIQQKENPDKPLTIKDLRAIPGFDYNDYKRALEELNVEILKRIARETYAHKFQKT